MSRTEMGMLVEDLSNLKDNRCHAVTDLVKHAFGDLWLADMEPQRFSDRDANQPVHCKRRELRAAEVD